MGIDAVLSVQRDRCERPVAHYSQKVSPAECNYAISELECLAISLLLYYSTFCCVPDGSSF